MLIGIPVARRRRWGGWGFGERCEVRAQGALNLSKISLRLAVEIDGLGAKKDRHRGNC